MNCYTLFVRIVFTSAVLTVPLFSQYAQMDFPMHVGDRWQYVEAPSYFSDSRVLGDTIMPNGLKYTALTGLLTQGYYRKEGPRLYQLFGATDRLICDFSKKPGDTLAFYRNGFDTTMVVVLDEGLWQCFDKPRYQMRFLHVSKHSPGIIRALYHVADSVGFMALAQETVILSLTAAVINGRQYGVLRTASAPPILIAPSDLATGVRINPTFAWHSSAGTVSYHLQVSTDSTFATAVFDRPGLTDTTQRLIGLSHKTIYYWRVNATGADGTSPFSATFSFRSHVKPGDFNGSGEIKSLDAYIILFHVTDISILTGDALETAEVSGDGTVSAYDAALVLQVAAGLLGVFPVDQ